MSTVLEVIVAMHSGLRVLGLSCITDLCIPDTLKPVDSDKVIAIAREAEPRITKLVQEIIRRLKV
jgi:purine-nucleoside phosphorylase